MKPNSNFLIPALSCAAMLMMALPTYAASNGEFVPQTSSPSARKFNWQQAVDLTRANSADLKAAEANLASTEAQEGASHSGYLPQLTGNLKYEEKGPGADGNDKAYTANLETYANLFNGFQDLSRVAQARANTAAARAQLASAKAKLSYDLKSSYEGLLFAQRYITLTHEILRRRLDNLRMVELRFDSGRENKGSVLLARAYLAQANYDELQAKDARAVANRALARDLGIDDDQELAVVDDLPVREPTGPDPAFRELSLHVPERMQAVAQEEAARQGVGVARSGFLPTLGVNAAAGRVSSSFFPKDNYWGFGLTLSFPLFNGGKDYYGYHAAVSQLTASSSNRLSLDRGLLARLAQSYSNYVEALARLKVDQSFRDAQTLRAEIARNKYNNGLLNFDDWDLIENDLINREKTYVNSLRDRVIAEAAWEQAQGVGVIP